jgi:hypothetical protein
MSEVSMSGSETVAADQLRKLADDLDEVRSTLEEAARTLEEAEVGGAAFSFYGLDMAVAYPSAHAFATRDAESKAAHVETVQERLRSTAKTWDDAERASTVSRPG